MPTKQPRGCRRVAARAAATAATAATAAETLQKATASAEGSEKNRGRRGWCWFVEEEERKKEGEETEEEWTRPPPDPSATSSPHVEEELGDVREDRGRAPQAEELQDPEPEKSEFGERTEEQERHQVDGE